MALKAQWTLAQELERFRDDMRANKPMTRTDRLVLAHLVQEECDVLHGLQRSLEALAGHTSLVTYKKTTQAGLEHT